MTPTTGRSSTRWLRLAGFAVAAYLAVFQLPFLIPPRQLLVSSSYVFGFNNTVAILAVAASIGALTLYQLWSTRRDADPPVALLAAAGDASNRLSVGWLVLMAALFAALTAALYVYTNLANGPRLTWESQHFLHRLRLYDIYGQRPYVDFSAEYGPLLMYPPAWLHWLLAPLGVSREGAYFLCHWVLNVAGLGALFYVLQQLKGPRRVRVVAFVVVGIAGFGPWMGLNGALIRYTLPFASVLLAHRLLARDPGASAPRRGLIAFLLAAVLLAANALTSPEIGAAFVFGWGAYCALRLFQKDWPIAAGSLIAIVATGGVAPFVLPAAYYTSLLRFSQGANNLPLLPAAHPLLFLVTLLMVVPPLLLAGWRGRAADAPLSGAMGVLCLGMMPGALGRGDPPHVLYYGLVASAILIVQLGTVSGPGHRLYTAAYGFVFIGLTWVVTGTVFLGLQPRQLISNPPRAIRNVVEYVLGQCAHADRPRLDALKKYRNVGLPLATYGNDNSAEVYLLEQKRVLPEYFVATVGVYTEAELARKLVQVERAEYILVARGLHEEIKYDRCDQHRWTIRHWLLYPARLECRNLDLDTFGAVNRLIATQYDVVETVGRSVVMRRRASEARTRHFTSSKSPGFQLRSNAAFSGP